MGQAVTTRGRNASGAALLSIAEDALTGTIIYEEHCWDQKMPRSYPQIKDRCKMGNRLQERRRSDQSGKRDERRTQQAIYDYITGEILK